MDKTTISIAVLVVLAAILGTLTARRSEEREPIYGGIVAKVGHHIAAVLLAMVAPTVLCSILVIHPNFMGEVIIGSWNITAFAHAVLIAIIMVVTALVCLMIYAILAKPYLDRIEIKEDRGWTAEDAKTSGL